MAAAALLLSLPLASFPVGIPQPLLRDLTLMVWVALAITGLLLVEQIYRNAKSEQRWSIKYLCFALGAIFAYDFYMYADSLLLKHMNPQIWKARGIINALVVPLIAISVARNPGWDLHIHVSRNVVFHSFTLMGTGIYLILMAISGYLIRFYGGAWGGVIQVVFLCLTGALLVVLLFSDRIRAQMRVLLSKHFFSFKYDYRQEWSRFTDNLSSSDASVPNRVIFALASLIHSNCGLLWLRGENGFELLESWRMRAPSRTTTDALEPVAQFAERQRWVIDISEYQQDPGMYQELQLPEEFLEREDAWLIIPLFFGDSVIGLVLLGKPEVIHSMNWEDHDLLKVAGRQAASELAQYKFNRELVQARQFEAFNRLSAYVVHDLKNILAQQSLIVSNAEKHKHNPAFVDDMVSTVKNSVNRMTRLMEQMRSGIRGAPARDVEINDLLKDIVERHSVREPRPQLKMNGKRVSAPADREQLATVFGHIIQNAQDACRKNGTVEVKFDCLDDSRAVVSVRDNGVGMDEKFIRERLFRPFDSTKGLTGMGVGAFESREYVRSLGGDIEVTSTPGVGSLFRIVIPCQPAEAGD
jgi:putative PEP-CTERM system histidine kinase